MGQFFGQGLGFRLIGLSVRISVQSQEDDAINTLNDQFINLSKTGKNLVAQPI